MWRAWFAVLALVLLALLALFDGNGQLRLKIDASADALVASPQDQEAKQPSAGQIQPEELLLMLKVPDEWNGADVRAVAQLATRLRRLPGVIKVETPFTTRIPVVEEQSIDVSTLMERLQRDPGKGRQWIDQTFDEYLLKGFMTNRQAQAIVVRVTLLPKRPDKPDPSVAVQANINAFLAGQTRYAGTITGAKVVEDAIGAQIMHDLSVVLILTAMIIPVVLLCSFSGFLSVLLPMLSISMALLLTLAGMALTGININLVTAVVPPLVIALTLAYSMHALCAAYETDTTDPIARRLVLPLVVTGVTTLAGFLALGIQSMPAIRDFSFAGAIGVVAAQVSVLLIQCYGLHGCTGKIRPRVWLDTSLRSFASTVHRVTVDRRRTVIGIALAIFGLGILGAMQMEAGAKYIRDLPPGNEIRDNFDSISNNFGGANGFEIVIEGAGEDAVLLPSVLRSVNTFQLWLDAQPEIGGTISLVDFVKRLHQTFTTGEPEDFRVPDNYNLVKQLLIIGAPDEVDRYANLDYSKLIIRVRTPIDDAAELNRLLERIELQIEALPTGVKATLQGNAVRLSRTVRDLTSGQLQSFGMAILAIFLVISAVFASFRMGIRAMLPNLLPIAVYYGMIGMSGISLSPTMALLACIVLGIAVDDTLFYLVRFNRAARSLANEARAAKVALNDVIGPVTLTTVALVLCFLTMTTSEFESQYMFAILAALTLLAAWITDLTLTPAIGARSSIVTLFDVVSVDLGTAPQLTIPLFKDMSPRQAKLFALLSRIVEVPAGECFIRVGDPAGDIYVVIEGTGYAWFDRNGTEVQLADFKRGNTFGEASTFIKHRTANVTAATDMRLLAFDPKTLDRIRIRYPRIAALVFRNLSAIQAARLDRTTRKLEELSGNIQPQPTAPQAAS